MNEGEDTPIEALYTEDSAATDMKRKTKAKHHHLQRNRGHVIPLVPVSFKSPCYIIKEIIPVKQCWNKYTWM